MTPTDRDMRQPAPLAHRASFGAENAEVRVGDGPRLARRPPPNDINARAFLRASLAAVALAAAVSFAGPARAAPASLPPAQQGMVDAPCQPALAARPASVDARLRSLFDPDRTGPPSTVPPADQAVVDALKAEQQARDWPNLCRYHADDVRLAAAPAAQRQVVFLGDSITELWGVARPDLFQHGWVNRGVSGQTTPQMLLRFQADVIALHPRVVHILAATNDIAGNTGPTSMQDTENNLMAMVTLAKANHVTVILGSVPPTKVFAWAPQLWPAPKVAALNAWMKAYARREGLLYADYYSRMAEPDGGMKAALTFDGVHPNGAGYGVMAPIARKAVRDALARPNVVQSGSACTAHGLAERPAAPPPGPKPPQACQVVRLVIP